LEVELLYVKLKGRPLVIVLMTVVCHPPKIAFTNPFDFEPYLRP
jgi:hypothetical protein